MGDVTLKKIISSIADSYGLWDLNKTYSKINQFHYDEIEIAKLIGDYQKFYFKPDLPKIKFENNRIILKARYIMKNVIGMLYFIPIYIQMKQKKM